MEEEGLRNVCVASKCLGVCLWALGSREDWFSTLTWFVVEHAMHAMHAMHVMHDRHDSHA